MVKQKKQLPLLWSIKQNDPRTQGAAVVFLEQAFTIADNCVTYLGVPGRAGEAPVTILKQAIDNYNTVIKNTESARDDLIAANKKTGDNSFQKNIEDLQSKIDLMKNRYAILVKSQTALDTTKLEKQLAGTKELFLEYAANAYKKTGALDGNYIVNIDIEADGKPKITVTEDKGKPNKSAPKPIESSKDLTDRITKEWSNLPSNKVTDEALKNTISAATVRMTAFLENFVEFPYRLNEMEDILKLSQEAFDKAKPGALTQFQTAMREYEKAMVVATEFVADYFKALAFTGSVPLVTYYADFAGLFTGELADLRTQKPGKHTTEHILHAVAQNKYRNNPVLVTKIMNAYKTARARITDKYAEATQISEAVKSPDGKGGAIIVYDPNVARNVFDQLTEQLEENTDLDNFLKED